MTIRGVAERIEYSPPTIYEHFASKDALLVELMREGFRLLMERVRAVTGTAGEPAARVRGIALAYWEFAWEYPELYQVMHGLGGVPFCVEETASAGAPPEAKELFAFAMDAVKALNRVPAPDCDDIEASVHMLWATLHGLVALTMAGRIDTDYARAAGLIERAVRDFLAARVRG
jgi:AcrR family transcriptional regulator